MKISHQFGTAALAALVGFGLALSAHAQTTNILVNDTWRAGNVATPGGPYPGGTYTYAENNGVTAVDSDGDGDLSSAWFSGATANLYVVTNNPTPPVTGPNLLEMVNGATSSHFYTYFTQPDTAVTLSGPGQEMKLTWVFTPTGVNSGNSNAGLTLALGDTPNGTRSTNVNQVLAKADYTNAYAAFMNMGNLFGTTPLALKKWTTTAAGSLAGTSGNYSANLATGGASLTTGYSDGNQYTFTMDLSMTTTGLVVQEKVSGAGIGGSGTVTATYTDASQIGQTLSYDTFVIRPTSSTITAGTFDTSLFQVETITAVPEPSTVALVIGGLGLMTGIIRRRRRS
jgi:PEP-CTERM motif